MHFTELPADIFHILFSLVKTKHLTRLWLSGDFSMQWKMSDGDTVQKYEIREKSGLERLWPSIISRFHKLTTLSLLDYSLNDYITFNNLSSLPETITDLTLPDIASLMPILKSHPELALFSNLKRLELPTLFSKISIADVIWPRGLEEIFLRGSFEFPVFTLVLSQLPPHLTKLEAWQTTIAPNRTQDKFPSSLTYLSIKGLYSLNDISHMLPSGLTHCCLHASPTHSENKIRLSKLPPNLTHLDVPFSMIKSFWTRNSKTSSPSLSSSNYLPSSLTSLDVGLKIFSSIPQPLGSSFDFTLLPSSLTKVVGIFPSLINQEMIAAALPRSLTELSETVSLSCIDLLPPNITSLVVGEEVVDQFWRTASLAPVLVSGESLLKISRLPLVTLRCLHPETSMVVLNHPLPPTLRILEIASLKAIPISLEQVKNLPRNLREFVLPSSGFASSECFSHLPHQLNTLEPSCSYSEPSSIPTILEEMPSFSCYSTLTKFELRRIALGDPHWISHLPNSIIHLTLNVVQIDETWNSRGLQANTNFSLPSSLEWFWMNFNNAEPHFGIIPFLRALPPLVKGVTLSIGSRCVNCGIVSADLKNLPRNLKKLWLPASPHVSESCLPFLPDRLKELRLEDSIPDWFQKARNERDDHLKNRWH
jgi:hypothetical protein